MFDELMKVSKGFKLVYVGLIIIICTYIAVFIGLMVALQGGVGLGLIQALAVLAVLGSLAGTITSLIGKFFCLAIPERAGAAKALIMVSIIFEILGTGEQILQNVDLLGNMGIIPFRLIQAFDSIGKLFQLASPILFLFFTRSVAQFVRRPDLANKAMTVLKLWVAGFVCLLIAYIMIYAAANMPVQGGRPNIGGGGNSMACVGAVLVLAALVILLIALVQFANLLSNMSIATAKHARRVQKLGEDDDDDDYEDDEEDYDDRRGRPRRDEDDEYDDDEDDRRQRRN